MFIADELSDFVGKNEWRKLIRHGIVRPDFYKRLRECGIIREDEPIPQGSSKIGRLLDFLRFYRYETDQARSAGHNIFRQIIKARTGLPDSAFGLGDYMLDEAKITIKRRVASRD